jgi:hypothetical protein
MKSDTEKTERDLRLHTVAGVQPPVSACPPPSALLCCRHANMVEIRVRDSGDNDHHTNTHQPDQRGECRRRKRDDTAAARTRKRRQQP